MRSFSEVNIDNTEGYFMSSGIASAIATLAVAVLLFLLCRAIVLWYWRVGEAIDLLKRIDEKLGRMAGQPVNTPRAGQ
jgi:hypothetical protein